MDLVAGVRKEGSRGGRTEFKWSDVKDSAHRENYLGHSLMAPVGRWQQGRDLQWYAKGDVDDEEEKARKQREERQRVKDAEEEAMARALGLPITPKAESNANLTPLGVKETAREDDDMSGAKEPERESRASRKPRRDRSRSPRRDRRRDRSDDRGRDRDRRHRRNHDDRDRHHRSHRHRSRSRGREHRRRQSTSRSRSRQGHKDDSHHRHRRVERTYSPAERRRDPGRHRDRESYDRRH